VETLFFIVIFEVSPVRTKYRARVFLASVEFVFRTHLCSWASFPELNFFQRFYGG